ncbi:50S ribosomal protein L1 [Candidatus Saccharibacteria bacterium]|nr:50S ribosomal protein L1 [Candidatus Saccharibacteria bacterium]
MSKKAELLQEAKKLKLKVSEKNTIAEIEAAIKDVSENVQTKQNDEDTEKQHVAKAGKRSEKGIQEAEAKQAKIDSQKSNNELEDNSEVKPKIAAKPARSRLERRGKKYRKAAEKIKQDKKYTLKEALSLAIETSTTNFDSSVELHVRLGVDPRQADQNIRDVVVLPSGTGKTVRIAVFGDVEDVQKAKKAGADIAGEEELLRLLDKEQIDFDVLISTPTMMAKLGKYAKVLGPKGLMPNPKSGTVTSDVAKAISEAKAGRVEYRVDSTGIIHVGIGKVSFGNDKLLDNANALIKSIKSAKPSSIKGAYVKSAFISSSMGPSIQLEIVELN